MYDGVRPASNVAPETEPPTMQCLGSKLVTNGLLIDTVSRLGTPMPHGLMGTTQNDSFRLLLEGVDLLATSNIEVEDAIEIMLGTLLCGSLGSKSNAEVDHIRQSMFATFGYITSLAAGETNQNSAWLQLTRHFAWYGLGHITGRRWCITENGNFGLVPGATKKGDHIAMLCSSPFPFFLRPVSEEKSTEYALVGHGYLHDLGRGKLGNNKTRKPQKIVLV